MDDSVWHVGDFSVFSGCEQLAQAAELMKPRLTSRQQHRVSQVKADETASDYYKRSIWFPYLDVVISHMGDKFSGAAETAILLSSVLTCEKIQIEHFKKVLALYGKLLGGFEEVLFNELIKYLEYTTKVSKSVKLSASQSAHIWEWVQYNKMTYLTKERDKTVAKHRGCQCWMH